MEVEENKGYISEASFLLRPCSATSPSILLMEEHFLFVDNSMLVIEPFRYSYLASNFSLLKLRSSMSSNCDSWTGSSCRFEFGYRYQMSSPATQSNRYKLQQTQRLNHYGIRPGISQAHEELQRVRGERAFFAFFSDMFLELSNQCAIPSPTSSEIPMIIKLVCSLDRSRYLCTHEAVGDAEVGPKKEGRRPAGASGWKAGSARDGDLYGCYLWNH